MIYGDKGKVGCGVWLIFAFLLSSCLLPRAMPLFFMSNHYGVLS